MAAITGTAVVGVTEEEIAVAIKAALRDRCVDKRRDRSPSLSFKCDKRRLHRHVAADGRGAKSSRNNSDPNRRSFCSRYRPDGSDVNRPRR